MNLKGHLDKAELDHWCTKRTQEDPVLHTEAESKRRGPALGIIDEQPSRSMPREHCSADELKRPVPQLPCSWEGPAQRHRTPRRAHEG